MIGGRGMGGEEVLNLSTWVRGDEGVGNKTCLYCGAGSHYMADCVRYMNTKDQGMMKERPNVTTSGRGGGGDRID